MTQHAQKFRTKVVKFMKDLDEDKLQIVIEVAQEVLLQLRLLKSWKQKLETREEEQ
tara:strand:+ start:1820 stop:1987 length:168 start_codon:yes stop_codon:yes gene_type:complete